MNRTFITTFAAFKHKIICNKRYEYNNFGNRIFLR